VVGYCFITALVSGVLHFVLEPTIMPATYVQWVAIFTLGVLPLGLGFYAWDRGMKQGDIMVLGAAAYTAPLLSTLILLLAGFTVPSWFLAVACLLITLGALVAAKDLMFKN
jgi:drug/metabolite transporter (DMT)-like permease